jgi:hypothetical protein
MNSDTASMAQIDDIDLFTVPDTPDELDIFSIPDTPVNVSSLCIFYHFYGNSLH